MKHVIIGTAGHIDHGKTTLIKALTGRETDTLREEKERGISINLGFTFFDLPSGKRAGIIDVPGHEKFIKNMLAGVSSIDAVLLVIAADEGIMPQTKEHFEILQLLDVKNGIIVITKSDMVDEEWLAMVKDDVKKEVKGTFLENATIHTVSSKTGEGIKELVYDIDKITDELEEKDIEGHFRLPVDRVFSVTGFGTVATGTVISGTINEGDTIEVYPSKTVSKVRGIQVHDESVKMAEAGQRCALNISNVKVKDIKRGDVISVENLMEPSMIVDCSLYYLKSADRPLENRQRVRLYHGTSEIICRVVILDREQLNPGESAYVQLRLEKPLTAQRNDRYVIRSYSPMYTIGGGSIIDPNAKKAKRFYKDYIEQLKTKKSGKTQNILEDTVKKLSSKYPNFIDILKSFGKNEQSIKDELNKLVDECKVIKLGDGDKAVYIDANFLSEKAAKIKDLVNKFHEENPLKLGFPKEEIKGKVFGNNIKQKVYDELIDLLVKNKDIKVDGNFISRIDFNVNYTQKQEELKQKIIDKFKKSGFLTPKFSEIEEEIGETKDLRMVFDSLIENGTIVKVSEDCFFLKDDYNKAIKIAYELIQSKGALTLAEFRDELKTSRKYAVALLENFDGIKLTKRIGDKRILNNSISNYLN
ncbi:selenocysteine-specific translation elongation factor [Clostridium sp. JN-1]|uniref:selenocysteine-specific translation elongation factor n=1 Tax=Clostridium sp. JN-1 TaxID=2483110 RepID=UPI000F0BA8FF|nr:selenocysteine-specific translation elongation factor [Clostridium sp. JN-1]